MRLWTAAGAWAGLVAVALALFSVGLALNANQGGSGDGIIKAAVGFGAFATLVFAGDLFLLGRREVRRRRARRIQPPKFGQLDYAPELAMAVQAYVAAQTEINIASQNAAAATAANAPLSDQARANAVAQAVEQLNDVMASSLTIMREKVVALRVCLLGVLGLPVRTRADAEALAALRLPVLQAKEGTQSFRSSLPPLQRTMRGLRKSNHAVALNVAVDRNLVLLDRYVKSRSTCFVDVPRCGVAHHGPELAPPPEKPAMKRPRRRTHPSRRRGRRRSRHG